MEKLLDMLNLKESDFYRFRECYEEDNYIVVSTRSGHAVCWNTKGVKCPPEERTALFNEKSVCPNCPPRIMYLIENHPLYKKRVIDDTDSTYIDFFFKKPSES